MATVARVLGGVCVTLALVVAGGGIYGYVEGLPNAPASEGLNDIRAEVGGIYLLMTLVTALVLATIGAGAMAAGRSRSPGPKMGHRTGRAASPKPRR